MQKIIFTLFMLILTSLHLPVFAIEGSFTGNDTGVLNKQYMQQIKDYEIEKRVIETTESDIDNENQYRGKSEDKDVISGKLKYNPKFRLNKVIFKGNTVFSNRKLQKLIKDKVGQDVYLEDIMNMVVQISSFYHKRGYITSYAYLDTQEIIDGVVVINIKESKVVKKESIGNHWERERYLNNFVIGGHGLNYGNVFNARSLQGAMKNIRKSDYMEGIVELSKDKNNDTEIRLNVKDRFPLSLDLAWDDYGKDYTGRQRFTSILGIDNLTGFGDKIYGGTILAKNSTGVLSGYEIPVGKWGTKLGFSYSHTSNSLGGPYRNLGINGSANDYVLKLTHPIKNTATQEINLTVAFDWLNSKSESKRYGKISDYSLRVVRTSINGMFDDKYGRTITNLGVDIGIDGLGASRNIKGVAESSFYKFIATLARVQKLPKDCLGIVRINGQYSPQSLFPVEQMYLGGAYSLRGYQPSELLGDYGVGGSVELRTPVIGIKALFPKKYEDDWVRRVKLIMFYDWGYVNSHNNNYSAPTNFIHSIGFGTNINITDALSFQIGVGFPMSKKMNENSGRLYFSVSSELDKLFLKPKSRI